MAEGDEQEGIDSVDGGDEAEPNAWAKGERCGDGSRWDATMVGTPLCLSSSLSVQVSEKQQQQQEQQQEEEEEKGRRENGGHKAARHYLGHVQPPHAVYIDKVSLFAQLHCADPQFLALLLQLLSPGAGVHVNIRTAHGRERCDAQHKRRHLLPPAVQPSTARNTDRAADERTGHSC